MESYLYEEMFRLEERHWWFAAKHRIVLSLLARYLPPSREAHVADLGCGCGRMLQLLAQRYSATGIDASPIAIEFSRRRGVSIEQGTLPDNLPLTPGSCDAVLMLDVLEHLDDDTAAAQSAASLLKPEGILLITVPAYQWLYGPHDAAHHHRRRYSRRQLAGVLKAAGLRVDYVSYYNTLLFPLAVAQRFVQRLRGDKAPVSTAPPMAPINALFGGIFASERHLVGRLGLPFGLSLIAVARHTRLSVTNDSRRA